MRKKAQVTFGNAPVLVIVLVSLGIIMAGGVIALNAMKTGVTQFDNINGVNTSAANTSIDSSITAVSNFSSQLGTVGTMLGVGLILLIVLGVFGVAALRGGGGL